MEQAFAIAKRPHRVWWRYGVALAFTLLPFVLAYVSRRLGVTLNPTWPLIAALAAAAWFGGRGPGVMAAILMGLGLNFFFAIPPLTLKINMGEINRTALLVLLALLVSARRRAEEKLRWRVAQQSAIANLSETALARTDLTSIIESTVIVLQQALRADLSLIWQATQEGRWRIAGVAGERPDNSVLPDRGGDTQSLEEFTSQAGEPVIAADLRREKRFKVTDARFRSSLSVAIPGPERSVGVIEVFSTRSRGFSQADGDFLQSAANVLADAARRVRAEGEVEAQRRHLHVTLSSIGDAVIATDERGQVSFVNPVAEALTGWKAEDARGRPLEAVFRIINEQTREAVESPVAKVLRDGKVVGLANHTALMAKDGSERPIEDSAAPIKGEDGKLVGVVLVFRDVAERRRVAEEIKRSRDQMEIILLGVADGITAMDAAGRLVFANPEAARLVGFPNLEALLTVPISEVMEKFELWDEAGQPLVAQQTPTLRARGGERGSEATLRFRGKVTGEERWVQVKANPVFDERGQVQMVITIFRDMTERKQTEQERERLLANEQAARAKAEDANRLKDEFLTVVSHELRTPLNAILGWIAMLESGKLSGEDARRAVATIQRNARAQTRIVEDILDVSSIVTGKMRLELVPVAVGSLVESVLETIRPAAEAKSITLQAKTDREIGSPMADPHRLRQIVWNLLSNAVRFTPVGGRVEVQVGRLNSHFEITVSDTGQGISPDFLPFVFDRFRQADSSSTRTHGGLGLGLSIVRHLTELHGGEVSVVSPGLGQGSTFNVRLPLTPDSEKQVSAVGRYGETHSGAAANLEGLRVLVVDDETDTLQLLSTILTRANAEVKIASSAAEALTLLGNWEPDVIISDIGMPQMDGYELIRELRARGASIPAIALTAYARGEDRVRALEAGYQRHVAKPVEPGELTLVVAGLASHER